MDGHCAAAIVVRAMKNQEDDGTGFGYIMINYNKDFPFDIIKSNEEVILVDYSLQKPGDFEKLLEITNHIVWIDHHKTEKWIHLENKIKGIRQDGISACELTWNYFFPDQPIPRVVELLGDYDIWAFKFGEITNNLQAGIKLYDVKPNSSNWNDWLSPTYIPTDELRAGEIALKYRNSYYDSLIESWAFYTRFEGYEAIACNAGNVSSQLFDSVVDSFFDIMIAFVYDGKRWSISLYTKKDIDVSEIAKKYGGGGHKQAAGFQCDTLPFTKLENARKTQKV